MWATAFATLFGNLKVKSSLIRVMYGIKASRKLSDQVPVMVTIEQNDKEIIVSHYISFHTSRHISQIWQSPCRISSFNMHSIIVPSNRIRYSIRTQSEKTHQIQDTRAQSPSSATTLRLALPVYSRKLKPFINIKEEIWKELIDW